MIDERTARIKVLMVLNDSLARAGTAEAARTAIEHAIEVAEQDEDVGSLHRCREFLTSFEVPAESDSTERELYLGFVKKLADGGEIPVEQLPRLQEHLSTAVPVRKTTCEPGSFVELVSTDKRWA